MFSRVESVKKFTLRLHDDAFTVVCQAMNDLDTQVRAEAARILGCFTQVSEPFLLQTLDKKLTPKMKVIVNIVLKIELCFLGPK